MFGIYTDEQNATSDLQVRWDWEGDGTYDTGYSSTKTSTHQFTTEGNYTVRLEVKDSEELTATTDKQIVVVEVGYGTVTDIEGNVYKTLKIGGQFWMVENLKVTKYRNGDLIPHITDNTEWGSLKSGAYCYYDNDINNYNTYGLLYNGYTIKDEREIAPEGWHIPTSDDWKILG